MMQEVFAVLAILGMVVGSGFISGEEVSVFYSRFGAWSFLGVFISFFILFFLFKLILFRSKEILEKIKKSKFAFIVNLILSTIFSSSMFASLVNSLNFSEKLINFAIFCVILLVCCLIFKKNANFFNKINLIFVPFMLISFVLILSTKAKIPDLFFNDLGGFSVFYACLFCFLNASNGVVVLASLGKNFTKRQKTRVAFFSALVLSVLLLATNIVLLSFPILNQSMPILFIFNDLRRTLLILLIFIGSLTTLFSSIYSCSSSFRGIYKNEYINFFLSIIFPLGLSFIGFSNIVAFLYPLASLLGGMFLIKLLFIPSFERCNKKIHSSCKKAKDENASHNDVKF